MNNSIFYQQNSLLKFFLAILGAFIAIFLTIKLLLFLFIVTFFYLYQDTKIIIKWLQTSLKIVPLFISIFIFGIIFKIDFFTQLTLSLRILFILFLSVYLTSSTSIDFFLQDTAFVSHSVLLNKFRFFGVATINFLPIFWNEYKNIEKTNILATISNSISNSFNKVNLVEKETIQKMNSYAKTKFRIIPNLYLTLLIIIYTTTFWVNFKI
ncbi:MAG: hypothetical protein HN952_01920 [Candidatus Cloacimonetes bacterium]|jgi:hypothetical protein|nr:hypothetical protein [Candidatus Cloacimonadota bacterium]MBT6993689.1 hypothetical protein [Candidatus Cloacimonadota bacterium]MBT7469640.1 hypothetical protein [Candidatus Cloacimonadota bacterium]